MKVKLIAVLVFVATIFIGAVLWRIDSFIYGDRMSWVEAQTRTQVGAINQSLSTELNSLQKVVAAMSAEDLQKGKVSWNSLAPYYAISVMNFDGANFDPQVVLAKENSKAARWTKEFIKSAIGDVQEKSIRYFVKPFQDPQRGRYVGLVFIEGNRAVALFGGGENFQALVDSQRGSLGSFSVVTTSGLNVGHSIPEYLGTVMRDDPVFKESQKSGSSHGAAVMGGSADQEIYGMYESVPKSNLLVLSSAPLKEMMKGRSGLWWQFLFMGAGLVLVGLAGMLWVITPAEKEKEELENQLLQEMAKQKTIVPEKVIAPDPERVHKEKLQASMQVASALAHEMRGPLAAITGYSQMILAKAPEAEVVENTDSILRETRSARGILDKLLGYAGEEVQDKKTLKVEGPLVKALKELDAIFSEKGIKVERNFQENSVLEIHPDAMVKALNNILINSVEAMERMSKKEIKLSLFEDASGVHLDISDCGEGIEPGNIEKIFDPFFTTRAFHNHMGLGLSLAFGILKEHNADIQVESQRGQGTTIKILFKKTEKAVLSAPVKKSAQEEIVVVEENIPRLKEGSTERIEAVEEFERTKIAEVMAPASHSPLDVNIESLLELPEVTGSGSHFVAGEEVSLIDGFIGDDEVTVNPDEKTSGALLAKSEKVTKSFDDERTVMSPIAPPKGLMKNKSSKLDFYPVEIRRPGKRP